MPERLKNIDQLDKLVGEWTKKHRAEEVMSRLQAQGVPAGAVQNAVDLANDPQLKARDFFIELEHPETGKISADASPIKLTGNTAQYRRAAPLPGEDNNYVYGKLLGIGGDDIAELRKQGII